MASKRIMTCHATIFADEGAAALQLNEEQCPLSVIKSFHVYMRAGQDCHWALLDPCMEDLMGSVHTGEVVEVSGMGRSRACTVVDLRREETG